jgi:DNA-binding transcriptional regulator YhcF (GntR family)
MTEPQTAAGNVAATSVITIDRTSPVPLYFQLAQRFEAAIRSGALKAGSRLDNEVQPTERLGLSRPTVRAAFQYLSNKDLVVRKRGAGTLVANERIDRDAELTSRMTTWPRPGRPPDTMVIRTEVTHAGRGQVLLARRHRRRPRGRSPGAPPGPAWTPAPARSPASARCCSPPAAGCCAMGRTCARPGQLC